MDFSQGQATIIVVSIIVIVVCMIIFQSRKNTKPTDILSSKPLNLQSFLSDKTLIKVEQLVIQFAQHSEYKVEVFDETQHRIILSNKPEFMWGNPYGYLFPIYFSEEEGKTKIEVGIRSKGFVNPIGQDMPRKLESCYNGIKAFIFSVA